MTAAARLDQAIARAYQVFAPYPRPQAMTAPSYRGVPGLLHRLAAVPLREIGADQIGPYASWAMTTVGNVDDYRHFLPRLMELSVSARTWHGLEPQGIAGKLLYGGFVQWPEVEQEAVRAWLSTGFLNSLETDPFVAGDSADWLCGWASLGSDPLPLLSRWREARGIESDRQLARFAVMHGEGLRRTGSLDEGYWDEVPASARADVANWLAAQESVERLRRMPALPDEDDQSEVALALQYLEGD